MIKTPISKQTFDKNEVTELIKDIIWSDRGSDDLSNWLDDNGYPDGEDEDTDETSFDKLADFIVSEILK